MKVGSKTNFELSGKKLTGEVVGEDAGRFIVDCIEDGRRYLVDDPKKVAKKVMKKTAKKVTKPVEPIDDKAEA